eukprot:7293735-Alexandrium_andersonii.AAC.1
MAGFFFKEHGVAEYFGGWLLNNGFITDQGVFRPDFHAKDSVHRFALYWAAVCAVRLEVYALLTTEAEAYFSVGEWLR